MDYTKIMGSIFVGICLATISAAAKSFIDVEKLKVEISFVYDAIVEIKSDVRDIKNHITNKEK